jgi:hypothetical protein
MAGNKDRVVLDGRRLRSGCDQTFSARFQTKRGRFGPNPQRRAQLRGRHVGVAAAHAHAAGEADEELMHDLDLVLQLVFLDRLQHERLMIVQGAREGAARKGWDAREERVLPVPARPATPCAAAARPPPPAPTGTDRESEWSRRGAARPDDRRTARPSRALHRAVRARQGAGRSAAATVRAGATTRRPERPLVASYGPYARSTSAASPAPSAVFRSFARCSPWREAIAFGSPAAPAGPSAAERSASRRLAGCGSSWLVLQLQPGPTRDAIGAATASAWFNPRPGYARLKLIGSWRAVREPLHCPGSATVRDRRRGGSDGLRSGSRSRPAFALTRS